MTIVQINTFPNKATGTIMMNLHKMLLKKGYDSYVVWGRGRAAENKREFVISDKLGVKLHGVYTRLTDRTGFASRRATKLLLQKLDEIKPDIIHLHNIHGYYLNVELLFNYIRQNNIRVVWTLHDCWAFTGHCAYFDMIGCERWKNGCYDCPQKRTYPTSLLFDASKWNWKKKKELFSGLNLTIVTPSYWLKNKVQQSFLGCYPVVVINNGIDTSIFKHSATSFYEKSEISNKKIILGVASEWTERKGLKDFFELQKRINSFKCVIVLVGLNKAQLENLPEGIVGIERTSNVQELAGMYSQADYFFDPTYDDNFPTTNLESIACETPVITYRTGGSPETISDLTGWVVEKGDLDSVVNIIERKPILNMVHIPKKFEQQSMISSYLRLYRE